jgi:cyanophycinase-like exopeptidase
MGPIALHGGGEFLAGDEPFLQALLDAARTPAEDRAASCDRAGSDEPIRVVIVPTAAAGRAPDAAAALGTAAFERLGGPEGRPLQVETARVVDAATAEDPALAGRIAAADLVYLPGGDPALIPSILPGTAAWQSILAARARGAVLAGASAGAMALGPFTWTPGGVVAGLGVVPGVVVFPHADAQAWQRRTDWFPMAAAIGVGILGLGEQTGIIAEDGSGDGPRRWRVAGPAEVRWLAPGAPEPLILRDGQRLEIPG